MTQFANARPVQGMQKHRNVTLERLDKFTSAELFSDVNLLAALHSEPVTDGVKMAVFAVPNGQRITFDQATAGGPYAPCSVGQEFAPIWSTFWVKVSVVIPQVFDKRTVEFHFDNNAEGLVWTSDGRPVMGLTGGSGNEKHINYLVAESAKAGAKHEFYIEMAMNGMFGCGDGIKPPVADRKYKLATAHLVSPNKVAFQLLYDFQVLASMAKDLPKDSQRAADALVAANAICNAFDARVPETWQACRDIAATFLSKHKATDSHKVTAIGHCHIDTAWLWPYDETKRKCARSWAMQLNHMEKYPEFKFCASQAQQFEWVEKLYPDLFARIKAKTKTGQFVPIGGTWVEMDCNLPSGESFCRQFMYGQRYFEKHFGSRHSVFWLPDTFGYASQLPQIMKQAGLRFFFTQKLSWNLMNKFPNSTFHWTGLDGTSVLTHFSPADTYCAQGNPKEQLMCVSNHKDKEYSNESLLVFGNGDGGGGPLPAMIERLDRMKSIEGLPQCTFGSPTAFYEQVEKNAKDVVSWKGELYFELHRGTYTSQSETKRYNRHSELLLRDLECLATLSHVMSGGKHGYPYADIHHLWKLVLLNQFHDVLPGSSIGIVYDDALKFYKEVETTGGKLRTAAAAQVISLCTSSPCTESASVKTTGEQKLVAFNTTSFVRPATLVEMDIGSMKRESFAQLTTDKSRALVLIDAVPSFGYAVQDLATLKTCSNVTVTRKAKTAGGPGADGLTVINKFFEIEFDGHGRITGLLDADSKRELIPLNSAANFLKIFTDVPLFWDGWDVEVYHLEQGAPAGVGILSVKEEGPLRVVLEVTHPLTALSWMRQEILITAVDRGIEFRCHVDWRENRKLLKVEFPCNIARDFATYETQYGVIQRPTHYNTSWDLAKFEVCGHRFVDFSEFGYGVALLNDAKYGMAVHDNTIRLSLLRAPKAPDAQCDMGEHKFRYCLYPHQGAFEQSDVVAQGIHYNTPLYTSLIPSDAKPPASKSFFSCSASNFVIDTVKFPEPDVSTEKVFDHRAIILRSYETMGGRGSARISSAVPFAKAFVVNVLEDVVGELDVVQEGGHSHVTVPFTPFQLVTLKLGLQ